MRALSRRSWSLQNVLKCLKSYFQTDLSNRNEQQAAIAQDLVGTVKRLQLIHSDRNSQEPNQIKDFASVQALSSQLLQMVSVHCGINLVELRRIRKKISNISEKREEEKKIRRINLTFVRLEWQTNNFDCIIIY